MPASMRPALISHYSNVRDRRDIGDEITRHGDGGYFWEFSSTGEVLSEDKIARVRVGGSSRIARAAERMNPRSHDWPQLRGLRRLLKHG